mgnify:CR=1 FL=1
MGVDIRNEQTVQLAKHQIKSCDRLMRRYQSRIVGGLTNLELAVLSLRSAKMYSELLDSVDQDVAREEILGLLLIGKWAAERFLENNSKESKASAESAPGEKSSPKRAPKLGPFATAKPKSDDEEDDCDCPACLIRRHIQSLVETKN